jgi:hypothetical protein
MAKSLFSKSDITPRTKNLPTISSTTNLNNLLRINVKNISGPEIVSGFQRAINRASQRITTDLKKALDDALKSNVWSGTNGDNDIFDSGQLLSSGSVSITQNGIKISYTAPYANLIHYGGYIYPYGNQNARIYLPPRPWVESVLLGNGPVPKFDFLSYYLQEIRSEFR